MSTIEAGTEALQSRRECEAFSAPAAVAELMRSTWPPQSFTVTHHSEGAFVAGGLRNYAKYRDLGMIAATGGMVRAHVMRLIPPFRAENVSRRHFHEVAFQMLYCLKGWAKYEFEGQGEIIMREGSCWLEPPTIRHTLLGYSDDCELLEIVLPAAFKTVTLE
jgi:hypothetical protein